MQFWIELVCAQHSWKFSYNSGCHCQQLHFFWEGLCREASPVTKLIFRSTGRWRGEKMAWKDPHGFSCSEVLNKMFLHWWLSRMQSKEFYALPYGKQTLQCSQQYFPGRETVQGDHPVWHPVRFHWAGLHLARGLLCRFTWQSPCQAHHWCKTDGSRTRCMSCQERCSFRDRHLSGCGWSRLYAATNW